MTEQNKNLEKKRFAFFQIGMIISLSLVLFAFEWTTVETTHTRLKPIEDNGLAVEEITSDFEIIKKKEQKRSKPKVITNDFKLVDDLPDENPVDPELNSKPDEGEIVPDVVDVDIPAEEGDGDDVISLMDVSRVEIQPYYDDCYNPLDREAQSLCSFAKIRQHIQDNLRIPMILTEAGIEGKTWVSFIVDEDGRVSDVKILKGIHHAMDKEAIRIVKSLPRLHPASQQGTPVKVQYKIPINVVIH